MSSSPSSMFSARMPLLRMFLMASRRMRLTVPFFVTITMNISRSMSRTCSMAFTRSPLSMGMMLTMFVPRAVRPASGIW